ncbi:NAD-dependent epimerase/dehydratase family protein [Paracoccus sp. TOH]|uniref:NAD-dependent epimerase/dehydratase family protein n=1 Tax=Paracoccus sp. TOH TaxID=1263728 RepID=UPI0025B07B3D|nr:NAD-dependent epimerase/dehydratase family protein [Paracoccus sp. TOH]WJS87009.1 NAD-dependent epimerase/dehydratase family protein [Paracoccus sp. TOH]
MKLLHIGERDGLSILMFGLGLIGGAVDRALQLRCHTRAGQFPYDWRHDILRRAQRAAIRAELRPRDRIAMVWTGGQSGFASTEIEMAKETALVAELVEMAESLGRDGRQVDFHMLSSAGGLFEGQTHCGRIGVPRPLRPYGEGKRQQEKILARAAGLNRRRIYRPSSVYGVTRSRRVGLVAALVSNAMRGTTTRIYGNPNTLRDYVLADDIGHYIARSILKSGSGEPVETRLLASGRPASVFEVIERVRERMGRPLLLQFDPHPSNVRDMSFLPSALPADWQATSLASGIAGIVTFFRSGSA